MELIYRHVLGGPGIDLEPQKAFVAFGQRFESESGC